MKLATWNINGLTRRLDALLGWLGRADPDVVCLQELKCAATAFPADALEAAGYGAVWRAEGRWNGVAILARNTVPVLTQLDLGGDPADTQARYIEAAIDGRLVASIYAPNGNPQPGPKFAYKLAWMDRLLVHARDRLQNDVPIILAGDLNVIPTAADMYDSRAYDDNALTQPATRRAYQALTDLGLTDAFRHLHPDDPGFTFWDYRRDRWQRDAGLRLDLILTNDAAGADLEACGIDRSERARPDASDHAPLWATFADTPAR